MKPGHRLPCACVCEGGIVEGDGSNNRPSGFSMGMIPNHPNHHNRPSGFSMGMILKTKLSLSSFASREGPVTKSITPFIIQEALVSPGCTRPGRCGSCEGRCGQVWEV